jgi:phosphonate transport system substrate-binding protein
MRSQKIENQDKLIRARAAGPNNKKCRESQLVPANGADYNMIRQVYKAIAQGDSL